MVGLTWVAIFALCYPCVPHYVTIRPAQPGVPAKLAFRKRPMDGSLAGYTVQEIKENEAFLEWVSKYESQQRTLLQGLQNSVEKDMERMGLF